jgi:hypothetical protein
MNKCYEELSTLTLLTDLFDSISTALYIPYYIINRKQTIDKFKNIKNNNLINNSMFLITFIDDIYCIILGCQEGLELGKYCYHKIISPENEYKVTEKKDIKILDYHYPEYNSSYIAMVNKCLLNQIENLYNIPSR